MPRWITDEKGVWHPAKEKVALRNNRKEPMINPSATWSSYYGEVVQPGEVFIYEGPDRAAMFELFDQKVDSLGADFHNDPDLVSRVKQMGYKDVTEYSKVMGYDEKKAKDRFAKEATKVAQHELPEKVEAIKRLGGGQDLSGQGNDTYGGFGEPPK